MFHYLLEKSRLATRNDGEQNFHIFLQLYAGLAASGKLADYNLTTPSANNYLKDGPPDASVLDGTLETCGDGVAVEWIEVKEGMAFIGVSEAEVESMTAMLAAIILIGDSQFVDGGNDNCSAKDKANSSNISRLLKIDEAALAVALETTSTVTRGEKIAKNYTVEQALSSKDGFAKGVYDKFFKWMFEKCNGILQDPSAGSKAVTTIGVLDIFGFEVFKWNSIEQMCIDLTNEQLQGYFNQHVFIAEQKEYEAEGVDVSKIPFADNQSTLDLFLAKGGIFAILDEQVTAPGGSDESFTKACAGFKTHKSKAFVPARSDRDLSFEVTHYAGPVTYQTLGFLEKNRDKVSPDVLELLEKSEDDLIKGLFDPTHPRNDTGTSKKKPTLCSVFKASLLDLMDRMGKCSPHFIRCLKPNGKKVGKVWEQDLVTRQLRYAGVLETIKIRKLGYSFRMIFADFVKRYKNCAYHYHEKVEESKDVCIKIASGLLGGAPGSEWQVGSTKVFMKYYHADTIAAEAKKHSMALGYLQKIVKGHIARAQFAPLAIAAKSAGSQMKALFDACEDGGVKVADKMKSLSSLDVAQKDDRPWLGRVMAQASFAEADAVQKEEERAIELAAVADEEPEAETTSVNGYFVYSKNEHLTLKVGQLEKPWRKKTDDQTGRFYFKNTETKTTTWVDPRTHTARKHDPSECEGDDLPFGWDKAQTDSGIVFYINHLTNTHHKDHPKEELALKVQQLSKMGKQVEDDTADKVTLINELKAKRLALVEQKAGVADAEGAATFDARIADVTSVIDKETAFVKAKRAKYDAIESTITRMRSHKSLDELTC